MVILPWIPVWLSASTSEAAMPSSEIITPPTPIPILGLQAVKNRRIKRDKLMVFMIILYYIRSLAYSDI